MTIFYDLAPQMTPEDREHKRALELWAKQTHDAIVRHYESAFFNAARSWEIEKKKGRK